MTLTPIDEDWDRGLAVVAHPDDMEYGAAAAVARWTAQGKDIRYLLVTRGEAGIEGMSPDEAGPVREAEQRASCAAVGVTQVEFLNHPDGMVVADAALRHDLAGAIRRHRPEAIISINFRESWGGPSWNHVDHREVGIALLDGVRDAANQWAFTDLGMDAWTGVRFVAFSGSPHGAHMVDISDHFEAGESSLRCHAAYLAALDGGEEGAVGALRSHAEAAGEQAGTSLAATFEVLTP